MFLLYILLPESAGLPCPHAWIPRKKCSLLPSSCRIMAIQPHGICHLPSCRQKVKNKKLRKLSQCESSDNVHIIKSVLRIKFPSHSPALGGRAHLWEADLTLCPFSLDNLPCGWATTFPGAQPFPAWQRCQLAGKWPCQELWVLRLSNDCTSMDVSLLFPQGSTEPCESEWEISWI